MAHIVRKAVRTPFRFARMHVAASDAVVSATILPFVQPTSGTFSVSRTERAQAAGWAAHQAFSAGGTWWVETHVTDEGTAWLGVVTPSGDGSRGERSFAWLIERTSKE